MEAGCLIGKRVVVTGGAAGIGRATAIALGKEGAGVAVVDLNLEGAQETAARISESGVLAVARRADVCSAAEVSECFSDCAVILGGIDILINCAGGWKRYEKFEDIAEQSWDDMIALNLKSVYLCCHAAIPHMKHKGWGRIVNLGSLAGRSASAGASPAHYGAAKAAVSVLTQYLAKELGVWGITANTVAPGTTLTESVQKIMSKEREEALAKTCPLGRLAEPDEIAQVVVFLAGDAGRYVSGTTIDVNGGRMMFV